MNVREPLKFWLELLSPVFMVLGIIFGSLGLAQLGFWLNSPVLIQISIFIPIAVIFIGALAYGMIVNDVLDEARERDRELLNRRQQREE